MKKNINNFIRKVFHIFLLLDILASVHANEVARVEKKLPYSKGLNISEWLEPAAGFNDGNFGNYGKEDFIDIKNLGVEVVRVPTHFDTLSLGKPDYIIPNRLWQVLDNAIDWCEELGMYIIIDFHNDCNGSSKTPPDIEKRLEKIWPQIAERYKDRSDYVIYEVMNEPHAIDTVKWGKIQGNMIKLIRTIDKKHSIIVGAANWNSIHDMMNLPKYDDDNLIYNYHEYSPFLFTHQGADWTDIKRLTGIPFPYVKEKMPPLPKNATETERNYFRNYEKESSEKVLVAPLDKAVEFVNKRHAALMSNEFGVYMKYADPEERANWYSIKSGYLDDRNIVRVSWDYRGGFGVFNRSDRGFFPDELDEVVVKAMGYNVPKGKRTSWFDDAKKSGNYDIYRNGLAPKLIFRGWIPEAGTDCSVKKPDDENGGWYIDVPRAGKYRTLEFNFNGTADFSILKDKGALLEFEIRVKDPVCKMAVYFRNDEELGLPWRAGVFLDSMNIKCDGKWQKVSVPLSKFQDYGAWDNKNAKWENPRNEFSWEKISHLIFDTGDGEIKEGVSIRNISIK